MRKNIDTRRTVNTMPLEQCWRNVYGDLKMPRSPEKFFRKLVRMSHRDLKNMSLILKRVILEQFEDPCLVLLLVISEAELLEKELSKLYDECSWCRLRYRNGLDRSISQYSSYYHKASQLFEFERDKKMFETITPETSVTHQHSLIDSKEFAYIFDFNPN